MIFAVLAYLSWGFIPAYLKFLSHLPVSQVLFHRSLWSFSFFCGVLLITKKLLPGLKNLTHRQKLICLGTASLIGVNWGIYLYAVNTNQVIESSLGYFINPLVNMVLGTMILKETLSSTRKVAVVFATLGVLWLTFLAGHFPWIGLSLGFTFGLYGLIRKMADIPPNTALQVESLLLALVMFSIFKWHQPSEAIFTFELRDALLLLGSGFATGVPLYWFSKAVKMTPLNVLGFLQFISPTIQFLLGAFLYKEPFPPEKLIGFALIWFGVIILIFELIWLKNRRPKKIKGDLPSEIGETV